VRDGIVALYHGVRNGTSPSPTDDCPINADIRTIRLRPDNRTSASCWKLGAVRNRKVSLCAEILALKVKSWCYTGNCARPIPHDNRTAECLGRSKLRIIATRSQRCDVEVLS
jgi:hypothetical protein